MNKALIAFLLLIGLPLWAAGGAKEEKVEETLESPEHDSSQPKIHFENGRISRSSKNVLAPQGLIYEIEKDFIKNYRIRKPESARTDLQIKSDIPRQYLILDVLLTQKSLGPLNENTKFFLPRGGGVIDLAEYVSGNIGKFKVEFDLKLPAALVQSEGLEYLKVYFLSRTPRREIAGESYGIGCEKYLDLTSFFKSSVLEEGLLLDASEQKYINVAGGIFYFVLANGFDLFLGTVEFEDSRHESLFCPPLLSGKDSSDD